MRQDSNIPPYALKTMHYLLPAAAELHEEEEVRRAATRQPRIRKEAEAQAEQLKKRLASAEVTRPALLRLPDIDEPPLAVIQGRLPAHLRGYERPEGRLGFVYVATDLSELIKIGITISPLRRLAAAKLWNPAIQFLAFYETQDMHGVEQALHKKYAPMRHYGEWFRLAGADLHQLLYGKAP